MLRVSELSVEAGGRLIVKGVSFEVRPGELAYLLGPNGSGKSSLLKAIAGLPSYRIVRGRVHLSGEDITELPPWERVKRGLWLIHQSPPALTMPSYLLLEWISKKRGGGRRDVTQILASLGIEHLYLREAFNGFSGGEVKKLEIATALVSDPSCILLDEPDSGVDVDSLRVISKLIDSWLSAGKAVLTVTHLGAISSYLKREGRAYVMVDGMVVYEGRASEVIGEVLSEGYARFRGG